MRFHVRMGAQASTPPRAHVGPIPLLGGVLAAIALGVIAAIVITVAGVHLIFTAAEPPVAGATGPTPSQKPLHPGTYSAGRLSAPARLGALDRMTVTQPSQVALLQSQRDALRLATGKPAIAAAYGRPFPLQVLGVELVASSGYVNARQYLGSVDSGNVTFSTVGPDQCAASTDVAVLCVRSDAKKQLTVVVEGTRPYISSPATAAAYVNDAWKKLGG